MHRNIKLENGKNSSAEGRKKVTTLELFKKLIIDFDKVKYHNLKDYM